MNLKSLDGKDSFSFYNICSKNPDELEEIYICNLVVGELAKDKILWTKNVADPCLIDCLKLILEDLNGHVIDLDLYN